MRQNLRSGYNKWFKYILMKKDPLLATHLPETHIFSKASFLRMLDTHKGAVVKPVIGSLGKGVLKVSEVREGIYEVHHANRKIRIEGREKIFRYVNRKVIASGRRYLVQYLIPLASVNGNPFNFRTIAQRKRWAKKWVVTGKYAKVAGNGYFVTNLGNNGVPLPTEKVLYKSNVANLNMSKIMTELDQISLQAARRLSRTFIYHRIWGLDIGLDLSGKLWIIEPNFTPGVKGFRRLPDRKMLYTIYRYLK